MLESEARNFLGEIKSHSVQFESLPFKNARARAFKRMNKACISTKSAA